MKLKLYTASRLDDAQMWRELAGQWTEFEFTATWLKYVDGNGLPLYPHDAAHGRVFWATDHNDIARSDAGLVYSQTLEPLRGAIFEAGLAVAFGKPVILVGEHPSYSTWQYHSTISRVVDLMAARSLLGLLSVT